MAHGLVIVRIAVIQARTVISLFRPVVAITVVAMVYALILDHVNLNELNMKADCI